MENNKITLEEHKELGKVLRRLSNKLINQISGYPKSRAIKTHKLVSKLRCILDNILLEDYGNLPNENPNWCQEVYYGDVGN